MKEAKDMTFFKDIEGRIRGLMSNIGLGKHGDFPGVSGAWRDGRIGINLDNVLVPRSGNPFEFDVVRRGGLTIHGGDTPGSTGCIDLYSGFSTFKSMIQQDKRNSNEVKLKIQYNLAKPTKRPF